MTDKERHRNEALLIAIDALTQISQPIKYLQELAERQGHQLNGVVTIQLAKDPDYLKGIATSSLSKINELDL